MTSDKDPNLIILEESDDENNNLATKPSSNTHEEHVEIIDLSDEKESPLELRDETKEKNSEIFFADQDSTDIIIEYSVSDIPNNLDNQQTYLDNQPNSEESSFQSLDTAQQNDENCSVSDSLITDSNDDLYYNESSDLSESSNTACSPKNSSQSSTGSSINISNEKKEELDLNIEQKLTSAEDTDFQETIIDETNLQSEMNSNESSAKTLCEKEKPDQLDLNQLCYMCGNELNLKNIKIRNNKYIIQSFKDYFDEHKLQIDLNDYSPDSICLRCNLELKNFRNGKLGHKLYSEPATWYPNGQPFKKALKFENEYKIVNKEKKNLEYTYVDYQYSLVKKRKYSNK